MLLVHAAGDVARVSLPIGIASAPDFQEMEVWSRKFLDSELGYGPLAQLH